MKKFIRQHMSISILKQNIEVFYNSAIKVTLYLYWNFHIFKKLSNELSVNIESPINLLSGKEFTFSNKRPGNSLPFPDGQIDTIPSSQLQASNHQQVWKCTSSPPKRIQQVCVGMHILSTQEDPAGVCGHAPPLTPMRIQQLRPSYQRLFWPPKTHPSILPHWPSHKLLAASKQTKYKVKNKQENLVTC